ncbi:hypothetical protein KIH27_13095 [Mycobacterium sp. M1]|uniref:Uncharacterized protein n=1 Tax=Mycolicibacter acidiphilus TaxID=2835306 RepID=A0ABS5RJR0_9MYCO|nr:hypothetical protein [Mycolicibacter acidiphilus]
MDYSPASLRAVETLTLRLFNAPEDLLDDSDRQLAQALIAYIGLTLIQLSTGAWHWDDQPGFAQRAQPTLGDAALTERITNTSWTWENHPPGAHPGIPVVLPGSNLGLKPVSPLHLLLATVAERSASDGPCTRIHAAWQGKAPSRPPRGVPGIDIFDTPPPSPALEAWLADREHDFPSWATRYPGTWDFSPESIDTLTDLMRHTTPTLEDFNNPANADFVDGASWYLGEMLRRGAPSRWVHRPHRVKPEDSATVGYQIQLDSDVELTTPFRLLGLTLRTGDPRARNSFDNWVRFYGDGPD